MVRRELVETAVPDREMPSSTCMTSQTVYVQIHSQAGEALKKVMAAIQEVQRGEKCRMTLADTSLPIFSDGPLGGGAMEAGVAAERSPA